MKHTSLHIKNYNRNKEHNKRVAEFYKKYAFQIANEENGNGWLAKLERYIYNKGYSIIKLLK
jgi:hypothetical protein